MRIDGQSRDIELESLNLTLNSTDKEIREALANFLDKPVSFMERMYVDRSATAVTVRPEAVFGI